CERGIGNGFPLRRSFLWRFLTTFRGFLNSLAGLGFFGFLFLKTRRPPLVFLGFLSLKTWIPDCFSLALTSLEEPDFFLFENKVRPDGFFFFSEAPTLIFLTPDGAIGFSCFVFVDFLTPGRRCTAFFSFWELESLRLPLRGGALKPLGTSRR